MDVQFERRKLLASERKQKILEWVASEEAIDYASLARFLDVSVMTVRRDVRHLVDQGYMTLTRGGATAHLSRSLDILVNPRAFDSSVAKARIGEYAARNMTPGDEVAVLMNGLGSTPQEELYIMFRKVSEILAAKKVSVYRTYVGEFATSLEMAGASISMMRLDDELKKYIDHPVHTPFFTQA